MVLLTLDFYLPECFHVAQCRYPLALAPCDTAKSSTGRLRWTRTAWSRRTRSREAASRGDPVRQVGTKCMQGNAST